MGHRGYPMWALISERKKCHTPQYTYNYDQKYALYKKMLQIKVVDHSVGYKKLWQ